MREIILDEVELTDAEHRLWGETRTLILVSTPHFGYVLYELLTHNTHHAVFTEIVDVAATDGYCLILNPNTFFAYDPGERLFICCHEILHTIFGHPELFELLGRQGYILYPDGTRLMWVWPVAQWAADYVINAILIEGSIGKAPANCLYDRMIATSADDFLIAYRRLLDRMPPPIHVHYRPGKGQGGTTGAPNTPPAPQDPNDPQSPSTGLPSDIQRLVDDYNARTFDVHLPPGTSTGIDPVQAAQERNEAKWRITVDSAMDMARQQGRLPKNLERIFGEVIAPPVDWTEKLHATISRTFTGDRWAFDNPQHEWLARDIFVPGRSGFGAADIVMGGDVSGSVSDEELALCRLKVAEILEQIKPRRLFLIWCDAHIHAVHELHDVGDLAAMPNPHGGGGTDFIPVFEWVDAHRDELNLQIDGLVYCTDMYGTFPTTKPDYPVVWASVSPPNAVIPPFGEVVNVPRQAPTNRSQISLFELLEPIVKLF